MQTIKILLVDDNAKFLQLVKNILSIEKDIKIFGEARGGEEAIVKAQKLNPDIVLMDIRMPGMSGLVAASILGKIMPEIKTIMLTIYDIKEYREAAKDCGVEGYIIKKCMKNELVPMIKASFESKHV